MRDQEALLCARAWDPAANARARAGPLQVDRGATALLVAKAVVRICWVGEYSDIRAVQNRTLGSPVHDLDDFWRGRPRYGYAGVATLVRESWVEPFWAGPRTYGYEWVVLETDAKRSSWLDPKPPPRGGESLLERFRGWVRSR